MKVKCFDFEHERDLEKAINNFLITNDVTVIQICYTSSHFFDNNSQIYSFSALLLYSKNE